MRFIENGPDIPDDLLIAQDEGRVVFFCGAGVSMAKAGLPSFRKLLEDITVSLGVEKDSEAYKLFEQSREIKYPSIDAIFTELRRDFDKSVIEKDVARALKPNSEKPDLSAHKIMLQLATQRDCGIRLVTTNFDRLFEDASPTAPTHNPSNLLEIRNNKDEWGIIHLHGLVNRNYTGAENPGGFVLSGNEFGAAYLTHGWARDFVSAILENYVTVFVGYRADDPPIKYLLQGLANAGIKKQPIYAFEYGEENKVRVNWDDKSAIGIAYSSQDNSHEPLWASLKAWSKRSKDPDKWRKGIFRMARKGPEKLSAYQRGMVAHIVSTTEGAKAFRKYKPVLPASWLCVFDSRVRFSDIASCKKSSSADVDNFFDPFQTYCLDNDPFPQHDKEHSPSYFSSKQVITQTEQEKFHYKRRIPENVWDAFEINENDGQDFKNSKIVQFQDESTAPFPFLPNRIFELVQWIMQVADSDVSVWWCAHQTRFHSNIIKTIVLPRSNQRITPAIREAKTLILKHLSVSTKDHNLLGSLNFGITQLKWNYHLVKRCVTILQPRLKLVSYSVPRSENDLKTLEVPPQRGYKYSRQDLVNYDVEYKEPLQQEWINTIPVEFLSFFVRELLNGIEYALAFEKQITGHYPDLVSLESEIDSDFSILHSRFNSYVSIFITACERLGSNKPEELHSFLKCIPDTHTHLERIKLWLCSFPEYASLETYMEVINGLSERAFWDSRGHEIPSGIKRRWNEFSSKQRKLIRKKIEKVPHYKQMPSNTIETKKLILRKQFYWIKWLSEAGCDVKFDADQFRKTIKENDLSWEKLNTEFKRNFKAETQLIQPLIDTVNVTEDSLKEETIPVFDEKIYPQKELDKFSKTSWGQLLCDNARKQDTDDTLIKIATSLLNVERQDLSSIIYETCVWLRNIGARLYKLSPNLFDNLWKMCMTLLKEHPAAFIRIESDIRTRALNSASGNLARMLIDFPKQKSGKRVSYIQKNIVLKWRNYARDLINLPNPYGAYAIIFFAHNTHWIYHHDKNFAMKLVVNYLIDKKKNDSMFDAAWSGLLWNSTVFPQLDLYRLLLPAILDKLKTIPFPRRLHQDGWAWFLLVGWRSSTSFVSDEDFRKALLNGEIEFQFAILNWLSIWTRKIESGWAEIFPDFVKRVWPKQRMARTKDVSAMFVRIVLGMCKNLEEATQEVLPFITPTKTDTPNLSILSPSRHRSEIFLKHPNEIIDLLYAILTPDPNDWGYGVRELIRGMKDSGLKADRKRKLRKLKDKLS